MLSTVRTEWQSGGVTSAQLLLHPVRLRIVQALLGDRRLTTTELRRELPDVPAATLYRQVGTLADGGVLEVADERRVRGTTERTYRLRPEAASVTGADAAAMSVEEHRAAFGTFTTGLLAAFDRYLTAPGVDLEADLVSYRQVALDLSDEETRELLAEIRALLAARQDLPPAPGRRRRVLTTILLPDPPPSPDVA